jgi:hypothetical protein
VRRPPAPHLARLLFACRAWLTLFFAQCIFTCISHNQSLSADFSTKKTEWLQQVKATTKKADLDALVSSLREELGQLRVAKVHLPAVLCATQISRSCILRRQSLVFSSLNDFAFVWSFATIVLFVMLGYLCICCFYFD